MSATEQLRAEKKLLRLVLLITGLIGYGASLAFQLRCLLGNSSWSVLAEGISLRTGLSFGWVTNLIGLAVLLLWIPLRELPGLGTVLNVLLIGFSADLVLTVLPEPETIFLQIGYLTLGILMITFFGAVYLGARFGSGPRDGLMTGAVRLTGLPVWLVRTVIELTVLATGWLLGGTAGVGTVIIAFTMGPLTQFFLRYVTVRLAADGVRTA
ncbi:hypothetical protein D5S17_05135 [Pseudonocardiaceae bacterium YIM PH 21723]|nr:hypothetical protein D5S17_05135 [Pseudonocardiaceae bacterium YIM PH 21723]